MQGKYRHEYKYNISYADYLILRPRLRHIMKLDPHTDSDGSYHIHSIYFDNYKDKALHEKIDGIQKREKYRIRWYNDDLSRIALEKKMKINHLCMKYGKSISYEELHLILSGDYEFLKKTDDEILNEFYHRLTSERLKPVVQVSYTREPYIYEAGNVRITFDSKVKTSLAHHNFTFGSPLIPATDDPNQIIMEVKFDEYLPSVIANAIQLGNIRQNAFSKYGICRRFG